MRRIRGQAEALERALAQGADCGPVLQQLAAIRGAINALMAQVLESHLREAFAPAAGDDTRLTQRVDEMTQLVRTYLR